MSGTDLLITLAIWATLAVAFVTSAHVAAIRDRRARRGVARPPRSHPPDPAGVLNAAEQQAWRDITAHFGDHREGRGR